MTALRNGRATGLRYDLSGLTPFERAVLRQDARDPRRGGAALRVGGARDRSARAVRAVGSALGAILCPCSSRVTGWCAATARSGTTASGVPMKRALLSAEGVDLERLERLADAGTRYVGSDTTGVFCVPSCAHALRIRPAHQVSFRSADAALGAGYQPCRHCTPAEQRDAS